MQAVAGEDTPLKTKAYRKSDASYYDGPAPAYAALEDLTVGERWDATVGEWVLGEPVLADNLPATYVRDGDWAYTVPGVATAGRAGHDLRAYLLTTTNEALEVLVAGDRLIELVGATLDDLEALLTVLTGGDLNPVTLSLRANDVPLPLALLEVWDSTGTYVLRKGTTDAVGIMATGGLPPGDYLVRGALLGFSIPEQGITVPTGGGTFELTASQLTLNQPSADPLLCVLYGYLADVGGVNRAGVEVTVQHLDHAIVGGRRITKDVLTATTDENGGWSLNVYRGVLIWLQCSDVQLSRRVTVAADVDTLDWKDV